jgi:hypothetical protein
VGAYSEQTPMTDEHLRCDSCRQLMALTPGPETKKSRSMPPHYMHRGYAIEKPKRTYWICQPCLNAAMRRAVAA